MSNETARGRETARDMNAREFDAAIKSGLRRLGWNMPLLASLLSEPHVRFARRVTDPGWGPHLSVSTSGGFNPFERKIFVSANSPVALYCGNRDTALDARDFNASDGLVRQVLFMLHDYLHIWTYSRMRELLPSSRAAFLDEPVSAARFEDHVFCHLLSEAVATVGLDYWCLCEIDLDDVIGMGTTVTNLTIAYRLRDAPEYARLYDRGRFDSRSRRFFEDLAVFYCTGRFLGFSAQDLARSPKLSRWLGHELTYGEDQLGYARQWLAYLMTGRRPPATGLQRPVACSKPWQRTLIREIGLALEAFIREGVTPPVHRYAAEPRARKITEIDLRFMNLRDEAAFARAAGDPWIVREQFPWLVAHRASRFRFPGDDSEAALAFRSVVGSRSPLLLERFLAGEQRLQAGDFRDEPEDVYFIG